MTSRTLSSMYGRVTDTNVDAITLALRHAFDKNGDKVFDAKDLAVKGNDTIPAYARDGLTTDEISTALTDFQTKSNAQFAADPETRLYNNTLIQNARVATGEIGQTTMTFRGADTPGHDAGIVHDVVQIAPVYSDLKPENTPAGTAPGVYVTATASNGADQGAWQIADAARKDPNASARIRKMSTDDLAAEIRMMNGLADGYSHIAPGTALIVDIDRFVQNNGDAVAAMGGKPFFIAKIEKENSSRMVEVPASAPGYAGTVMMPESQLATANTIAAYATLPFAPALMGLRNAGPHENFERVSYNPTTHKWERSVATQADLNTYAEMTKAPAEQIRTVSGTDMVKATVIPTATAMFFSWGTPRVISYLKGPAQAAEDVANAATTANPAYTAGRGTGEETTEAFLAAREASVDLARNRGAGTGGGQAAGAAANVIEEAFSIEAIQAAHPVDAATQQAAREQIANALYWYRNTTPQWEGRVFSELRTYMGTSTEDLLRVINDINRPGLNHLSDKYTYEAIANILTSRGINPTTYGQEIGANWLSGIMRWATPNGQNTPITYINWLDRSHNWTMTPEAVVRELTGTDLQNCTKYLGQ